MKRKFLLLTTLLLMVSVMTNAQEYWIEGFYERHGAGDYTLKDVNTNGIKIDGRTILTETLHGEKVHIKCGDVPATMIEFAFENADFKCDNPDIEFQYWSEDINDWKADVEACKGQTNNVSKKDMVMMLVLDYSNSLKNERERMKNMAYNFIRNAANFSTGNIHIGIVAFSGMDITKVMEITPLTRENLSQFQRFIYRDAQPGMETALYYAFDVAMKKIENYVAMNNFDSENYNGSCMITFTDGLDNASINDQISNRMQRGSKNEYLAYLSEKVQVGPLQKKVLGLPIESYAVGFTGSEHFSNEDLTLFGLVLQKLTTATTDDSHFTLSDNFDDVERFFKSIFEQLTSRWKTLNLYIGEAQYGKVRWVLQCESPEPKPLPKPEPKPEVYTRSPWFGISAEFGYCSDFLYGLNFDMAFSLNESFAVGARLGVILGSKTEKEYYYNDYYDYYDYYTTTYLSTGFLLGPEIKITYPENNALLASCGLGLVNDNFAYFLRFGYKTKKSIFITAEGLSDGDNFGGGIGIGWSFGRKLRKK